MATTGQLRCPVVYQCEILDDTLGSFSRILYEIQDAWSCFASIGKIIECYVVLSESKHDVHGGTVCGID